MGWNFEVKQTESEEDGDVGEVKDERVTLNGGCYY